MLLVLAIQQPMSGMDEMTLTQRQSDLYRAIVQADEAAPGYQSLYAPTMGLRTAVQHPGLPRGRMSMYDEDVEMLAAHGYIQFLRGRTYFIVGPERLPE